MEGPADGAHGGIGAEAAAALAPAGAAALAPAGAPAVVAALAPADVAANARQRRAEASAALRERAQNLKLEQKRLRVQIKAEDQAHRRAVKKMKSLPTGAIMQCLRERGENV